MSVCVCLPNEMFFIFYFIGVANMFFELSALSFLCFHLSALSLQLICLQQPQAPPFEFSAFSFELSCFELSCFELQLHSTFSFDLSPLTFYSFHASPSHLPNFPTSLSVCVCLPNEMFFLFYFIGVANFLSAQFSSLRSPRSLR